MPSAYHAVYRVHGLLACNLAGGVAAHPVCDDVQPEVVVDQEGILVQLSALSDVGQSRTVVLQLIPFSGGGRRPSLAFSD